MQIEKRRLSELNFYPGNPRRMSDEVFEKLKKSISEFGYVEPLVINSKNQVIGGNQRLKALEELLPEDSEVEVVVVDLPLNREKALNLALNKIQGEFDMNLLKDFISDLEPLDVELTGLDVELEELDVDKETEEDNYEEPEFLEPKSQRGDIYQLGNHRLMCGDSTKEEDVEKLMNGQKVDIAIYDPPYGINIINTNKTKGSVGFGGKLGFIGADGIVPVNAYAPIIGDEGTETSHKVYELLKAKGIKKFIIFGGNYMTDFLPPSACWIVWDKREDIPSNNFADCELIWTSFDKPSRIIRHLWSGLLRKGDRKTELLKRIHPTQKPVGVLVKIIEQFTEENDAILDCFGGSGSTLIACEQTTHRICYMMEIDPYYCQVIIDRWEKFTGKQAIKL